LAAFEVITEAFPKETTTVSNLSDILGNINNAQRQTNNLLATSWEQSPTNGCEICDAIEHGGPP
jgi:hypothetical protein